MPIDRNLSSKKLLNVIRAAERQRSTSLNLNGRGISKLPPAIGMLTSLKSLALGGKNVPAKYKNDLSSLPEEIGGLKNLVYLDLNSNQLSKFPNEIIQLNKLTYLDLSHNKLIRLPKIISLMTNLKYLDLSFNNLASVPEEISRLRNLSHLDLRANDIKELPKNITQLKKMEKLYLDENPLVCPPLEIARRGLYAIKNYFSQTSQSGQTLFEGKLLIVGQGGVGKTCLMKRLMLDEFPKRQTSTEGIDVRFWEISAPDEKQTKMILNVWDFGGQEIYHATHQFFLTKRSFYILVWDARQEEEYGRIDYWLNIIETFAEDSPVLIVMNKADERTKDINIKDLRQQHPHITASGKVSAKNGSGIKALRNFIAKQSWKLPLMGTYWPSSWVNVRKSLETDTRYYMPYQEYLKLCLEHRIEESGAKILSQYLHDLGIILHFQKDILLKDTIILKPEWATDAVYMVLDSNTVQDKNGILLTEKLPEIWKDNKLYPPDKYATLLRLMANFELIFPIGDGDRQIVAELLPSREAEYKWDPEDCLQFEYHYEFLPAGVITRLIVRMHEFLVERNREKICWREGAYFEHDKCQALVKINPFIKIAVIQVKGAAKREFLAVIRSHFSAIHKTIKKIRYKEKVPCTCSPDCAHRFDYNFLLKCEEKGKEYQTCENSIEDVDIRVLLNGIEKAEIRGRRTKEKVKDRLNIEISPNINLQQHQGVDQKVDVKQSMDVKLVIKNELPAVQSLFEEMRDNLTGLDKKMDMKMSEIGDSLDEVSTDTEKEMLKKPFNKLGRFLGKLGDEKSEFNKIISGTKKGIQLAQALAKTYNKFAQWLSLPQVPDLFLGSEQKKYARGAKS